MLQEKFLELILELEIEENNDFDYHITSDLVELKLPSCDQPLRLFLKNVSELYDGKGIDNISGIIHHRYCGFSFSNYAEFLVQFHYSDFPVFGWDELWLNGEILTFNIANYEIEISETSSFFILLLGSHYFDLDQYYEHLLHSATIKIKNLGPSNPEDISNQAIYYINSTFFNELILSISIRHVRPYDSYEGFYELSNRIKKVFKKKKTKKIISDLKQPIIIYNNACNLRGETKFLGFYKVLEYYADRNRLLKIQKLRFDKKISELELIKYASLRNELDFLKGLLIEITTTELQKEICDFVKKKKLLSDFNFQNLIKEFYSFRNSIVHSKESKIDFTVLPNQFDVFRIETLNNWCEIAQFFANIAIKNFNNL